MLGLDLVEISRIKEMAEKYNSRFLDRVFTTAELEYCMTKTVMRFPELAARFAAKEAVVKALGTGMRGVSWKEVEVIRNPLGKPDILLHDRAAGIAKELGVSKIHISLTHARDTSAAIAMLEYGCEEESESNNGSEAELDHFIHPPVS
ncbi:MAG: holo-ACP synthase [Candidatus Margulisiibacteriota bacterium]